MNKIYCQKCKYYYVTWEQKRPHGCKAYGFKSPNIPSMVVKQNSGMECKMFELKNTHKIKDTNS